MNQPQTQSRLIAAGSGSIRTAVRLCTDSNAGAQQVATLIAETIRAAAAEKRSCVLGLPTGRTPILVYRQLVAWHRAGLLSFKHVISFNLDEYYPLPRSAATSYWSFMQRELFAHLDIEAHNIHIPRGDLPEQDMAEYAASYERAIVSAGGLDLVVLGIGGNGHIAFNEPGTPASSRTRLVTLAPATRRAATVDFGTAEAVPLRGITMGIATILAARRIVLLATGSGKASAVAAAVEGAIETTCPASFLQQHQDAEIICDPSAAAKLIVLRKPWTIGSVPWNPQQVIAATIDVAEQTCKPLLSLVPDDFQARGLGELLDHHGPSDRINLETFRHLTSRITGWPGGKPQERRRPGDIPQPDDGIHPKTIVVFSPHPDDDVIGMGGSIARLVEHGHQVHIVYQTAGYRAVHDEDLTRHQDYLRGACAIAGSQLPTFHPDHTSELKALIRRTEAAAGAFVVGVSSNYLHFIDSPLYGSKSVSDADIAVHVAVLNKLKPHQIYSAGDLADPNGTHRRCLLALRAALRLCASEAWWTTLSCWLYRGAWDDYEIDEIDRFVPLSPSDILRKRQAILRHQSQRDRALFPGEDAREFWQRAEERNRLLAQRLDRLGLAQYAALEAFVRWDPQTDQWLE
jgi:glucosamine-6-phosphate deaminase